MRVLADTNILLRLSEPSHALHRVVLDSTDALRAAGHELVIVPQNLYEFWSVSTRTVAANGLGHSTSDAERHISQLTRLFTLLRDERSIFEQWSRLVADHQIAGAKSYDTRIVAAMMRHGVSHLLTFNDKDFARYTAVTVLMPEEVAHGAMIMDVDEK